MDEFVWHNSLQTSTFRVWFPYYVSHCISKQQLSLTNHRYKTFYNFIDMFSEPPSPTNPRFGYPSLKADPAWWYRYRTYLILRRFLASHYYIWRCLHQKCNYVHDYKYEYEQGAYAIKSLQKLHKKYLNDNNPCFFKHFPCIACK